MSSTGVSVDNTNGCLVYFEYDGDPRDSASWTQHYVTEGGLPGAYDLIIADAFPMAYEAIAGDIDGDGQIEVVATAWGEDGRLALFKHRGDPKGPWDMQILKQGWPNANQVILVDLTGDGRLDIAACAERGSNELRWWRNEGSART